MIKMVFNASLGDTMIRHIKFRRPRTKRDGFPVRVSKHNGGACYYSIIPVAWPQRVPRHSPGRLPPRASAGVPLGLTPRTPLANEITRVPPPLV